VPELIYSIFTENQRARFEETWELDFALMVKGLGRFRSNAHYSRGTVEATFRHIPDTIPSIDDLGLPPVVKRLCALEQGLVLVTESPAREDDDPCRHGAGNQYQPFRSHHFDRGPD